MSNTPFGSKVGKKADLGASENDSIKAQELYQPNIDSTNKPDGFCRSCGALMGTAGACQYCGPNQSFEDRISDK